MASVLTDLGCAYIANMLSGIESPTPDFVAWGSGAGTSVKADTVLFTEETENRSLVARSNPAPDTAAWTGNIVALANKTITNAGIFSDVLGGRLFLKADFPGVSLAVGAAIQFIFTLRIATP